MGIDASLGKEPILSRTELVFKGHEATRASEKHPKNEDSFIVVDLVDNGIWAAAVFDGAGGHYGGDIASKLAAQTIAEELKTIKTMTSEELKIIPAMTSKEAKATVWELLEKADQRISAEAGDADRGMRTTGSLLCFFKDRETDNKMVAIANVGDSRVYLFRNGELRQLTVDDHNPSDRKNIVSQLLGQGDVVPHVDVYAVRKGDRFLICSDGVSDNLTNEEITNMLATTGVATAALLVRESSIRSTQHTTRSKDDDMTAIVIDVDERLRQPPEKPPEASPEIWALNQEVVIKRSSGAFELWKVIGRDNKGNIITANDQGLQKAFSEDVLIALNPPIFCQELNKLFKEIEAGGEVSGSRGIYSPKYLQEIIGDVLCGKDKLTVITSKNGLREKVGELLQLMRAKR